MKKKNDIKKKKMGFFIETIRFYLKTDGILCDSFLKKFIKYLNKIFEKNITDQSEEEFLSNSISKTSESNETEDFIRKNDSFNNDNDNVAYNKD